MYLRPKPIINTLTARADGAQPTVAGRRYQFSTRFLALRPPLAPIFAAVEPFFLVLACWAVVGRCPPSWIVASDFEVAILRPTVLQTAAVALLGRETPTISNYRRG